MWSFFFTHLELSLGCVSVLVDPAALSSRVCGDHSAQSTRFVLGFYVVWTFSLSMRRVLCERDVWFLTFPYMNEVMEIREADSFLRELGKLTLSSCCILFAWGYVPALEIAFSSLTKKSRGREILY